MDRASKIELLKVRNASKTKIDSINFFVTKTGEKYHLAECPMIKSPNSSNKLDIESIKIKGYEPCKRCNPKLK